MQICKSCLNAEDQAFPIHFNDGICSACENNKEWVNHGDDKQVERLYAKLKKKLKNKKYDCVMPVFGDREDWYVLEQLLCNDVKVLLTWVNSYFNTEVAWYNFQAMVTEYDVDSITLSPNISTYQKLVQKAFIDYGHILLPYQILKNSFAIATAIEQNIPNIIYSYHQATEFGGTFSKFDFVEGNKWSITEFDQNGKDINDFISPGSNLNRRKTALYYYPDDSKINNRIHTHYFSNYIDWDPEKFKTNSLLKCEAGNAASAFDSFYRAGCSVYYDTHDMLRFRKFGYIKSRDQISRALRNGDFSRTAGKEIYQELVSSNRNLDGFFNLFDLSQSGKRWLQEHHFDRIKETMKFAEYQASDSYCDVLLYGKGLY